MADGATSLGAPALRARYLRGLTAAVGQTAGAYGYTLAIWCTGAMLTHFHGLPSPGDVALFVGGAVTAFALVELGAVRGSLSRSEAAPTRAVWLAGAVNGLSAGAAVAAAYGLSIAIGVGHLAWPVTAFAASTIYFLVLGLQVAVFEDRAT